MSDIVLKGYVQKRRGVLTHLNERRLTVNEYVVFDILLMLADKETGSYMINAPAIHFWSGEQLSIKAAQRALQGLDEKGYIVRETVPGKLGVYPYYIDKFVVAYGAEQGKVLSYTKKANKIEKIEELLEYFGAEVVQQDDQDTDQQGDQHPVQQGVHKTKLETGDLKLEKGKSKGVNKSIRKQTPTPLEPNSVDQEQPTPAGLTSEAQDQNLETLFEKEPESVRLLFSLLYPNGFESLALFQREAPHARACAEILAREKVSPKELIKHNHTHKTGGLYFRSCAQMHKALTSETQRTLNDFVGHKPTACRTCKALAKKVDGVALPGYRQQSGQREILKGDI